MSKILMIAAGAAAAIAAASKKLADKEDVKVDEEGWIEGYERKETPNASTRGKTTVTTLILHYTAGVTRKGAVNWLADTRAKASAHFVVGRDGIVTQMVPLSMSAWHAGNARISNKASIGIEIVNQGYRKDGEKKAGDRYATLTLPKGKRVAGWWPPYTQKQIDAVRTLIKRIAAAGYLRATTDIRGHEDIATPEGRKIDPGPLFPWDEVCDVSQRKNHTSKSTIDNPGVA